MDQNFDDARHPALFFSKALNAVEQNYAAHDLKLFDIVDTIRARSKVYFVYESSSSARFGDPRIFVFSSGSVY